jgi:hypothetical protein
MYMCMYVWDISVVSLQNVYLHVCTESLNETVGAVSQLPEIWCLVEVIINSFNLKSGSTSSLFRYFDFNATSAENPLSQIYVVGKGIRYFTALSDSFGYSERACIQKSARWFWVRTSFKELSHESSARLSCSIDARSVTTALLAITNWFLIQSYHDSGAEQYSHSCTWRICRCSLT